MEHLLFAEGHADSSLLMLPETGTPYRLTYQLQWGTNWTIQTARLQVEDATQVTGCGWSRDKSGTWYDGDGTPQTELNGCEYVDIWPTPFTNSFPVRRLNLEIGQRREIRVAYIAAPELSITAVTQAYTRLGERLFRFESVGKDFQADIEVDEFGLVVEYPGLFKMAGWLDCWMARLLDGCFRCSYRPSFNFYLVVTVSLIAI